MISINNKLSKEYDFIIVGQGLAGTCLASELIDHGKNVLVFDTPKLPSSSMVAGGLFNPITGRNMVLTWKAHVLIPYLQSFYGKLEQKLATRFLFNLPLFRPFNNNQEFNEWHGKSTEKRYSEFIDCIKEHPIHTEYVKNDLGGIMLKQTGYLDTRIFLTKFRSLLKEKELLLEEQFLPENINFNDDYAVYKEYCASKIIFCDGSSGFGNRYLKNIRFHPVKGEVLQLEINYHSSFILNRNAFVLPRNGNYTAGSNYNLEDTSWEPTAAGRHEILAKIDKILNAKYKVINQTAGIRPTSHDRRPVIGLLPNNPRLGVFNGLGTKGVSLAPFFAHQFAEYLVNGVELDKEVHISRYFN